MADPLLRLIDINKSYPGVRALSRVSLTVNRGEVLGLIGENGAGKSTLMKILGGVVKPDQGTIEIDGAAHEALTVPEFAEFRNRLRSSGTESLRQSRCWRECADGT